MSLTFPYVLEWTIQIVGLLVTLTLVGSTRSVFTALLTGLACWAVSKIIHMFLASMFFGNLIGDFILRMLTLISFNVDNFTSFAFIETVMSALMFMAVAVASFMLFVGEES